MGEHSSSSPKQSLCIILLFLLQLTSNLKSQSTEAAVLPDSEVSALNAIASKLKMESRTYSNQSCADVGYNDGISCNCGYENGMVCHVTDLYLSNQQLAGSIPEELGTLTYVTYLSLSNNFLSGPIPESIGNMHSLRMLYLYNNMLNGSIPPALGDLLSLRYIYLDQNQLSGKVPDALGKIATLITLSLRENRLSGDLPPGLGKLSNLQTLMLESNNFTGKLPESFANLTSLQYFSILGNNMSGQIPSFIQNWKNLTTLSLMGNNFEGPLPSEIFKLENLEKLWISDVRSTRRLELHSLPLSRLTNLNSLILRNCNIGGEIPADIGDLKSLSYLDLSFNNLAGEIPTLISNLSLETLYLTRNMLSGSIPSGFGQSVQILKTNCTTVSKCRRSSRVYDKDPIFRDFSYNNFSNVSFTGPKDNSYVNLFACCSPSTINTTSPLQIMNEHCPNKMSKYNSLYINCGGESTTIEGNYYEEDNKTSAFYVSPKGNWAYSCSGNFIETDTKPSNYIRNMTCGIPVPDAPLYATARLCPLSLKYHGLCLHNGNYTVKLHFAEIVYTDDIDYGILGKRIFDIYIQGNKVLNDFNIIDEAKGPNKLVIKNFSVVVMNHTLEIHFYWDGKGSVYIPPYLYGPLISAISVIPDFELHKRELSALVKSMIAVSSFAILLLVSASVWKIGWLRRKRLHDNVPIKIQGSSVTSVTFRDIMDATQNFSPKMEIGRGGFGTVYKAELKQKGIIMAVKQLSPNSKQGTAEINNEVYSLSSLKHENLVQLMGAYSGNNQHLLLYEYMENNSLARALFDPQSSLKLSWQTRYKICLGIAKGLTYLHEESRLKIVHRDIKATNILLDKDLNAKISDFGLAKLYDGDSTHMETRVGGTHGYMAPEYAMRGILTEKADVYSFGVVTLELISGKNNAEYKPNQESVYLLDTAFVYHKDGKILDLVDKSVRYETDYSEEQAKMMLNLAMLCTHQSLTLRPTMSEVVSILEGKKAIEQVFTTQPPFSSSVFDGARGFRDYLSTDTEIRTTSTEVASSTFSTYFSSKERDETKNGSVDPHHDISDDGAISHEPS